MQISVLSAVFIFCYTWLFVVYLWAPDKAKHSLDNHHFCQKQCRTITNKQNMCVPAYVCWYFCFYNKHNIDWWPSTCLSGLCVFMVCWRAQGRSDWEHINSKTMLINLFVITDFTLQFQAWMDIMQTVTSCMYLWGIIPYTYEYNWRFVDST